MIRGIVLLALCACAFGIQLGGEKEVDVDSIENELFNKIRSEVVTYFNGPYRQSSKTTHQERYYGFYEMQSVTKAIVAGTMYSVAFTLLPTECHKNVSKSVPLLGHCRISEESMKSPPQQCSAKIWSKPWENFFNVQEMKCAPKVDILLHRSVRSVSTHKEHVEVGSFTQFMIFKQRYNRRYKSYAEQVNRYNVFRENMKKAHVLNALEMKTGRYGMTEFADMTETEFRNTRLSPIWDQAKVPEQLAKPPTAPAPESFDWRKHNAVTKVKNQGSCGSCWAFSTTGNIEGQWAIKKKQLISLSEQELVDCDTIDNACGGGLPSQAYKAIMKLGGLELESVYPYEGRKDQCHFKKSDVRAYVNGSQKLSTDEGVLAAWLAQNGPISIGINAFAMQFYFGGISHPWRFLCNPMKLDHGVLIVGYGVQGSEPYWIIKNSWGPSWGESGYYLVYRGDGVCGLNRMATSAVVN